MRNPSWRIIDARVPVRVSDAPADRPAAGPRRRRVRGDGQVTQLAASRHSRPAARSPGHHQAPSRDARPPLRRDPARDLGRRLAIAAGISPDPGLLNSRLHRNHRNGRGTSGHRRGYCLTLRSQQQHEADARRRCGHRDSREPGRHSRRHVYTVDRASCMQKAPIMARSSGRRPGILQAPHNPPPVATE